MSPKRTLSAEESDQVRSRRVTALRFLSAFLFVIAAICAGRILLRSLDAQDGWPTLRAWLGTLVVLGIGSFVMVLGQVIADISERLRQGPP